VGIRAGMGVVLRAGERRRGKLGFCGKLSCEFTHVIAPSRGRWCGDGGSGHIAQTIGVARAGLVRWRVVAETAMPLAKHG
jgi:hypothetical protein